MDNFSITQYGKPLDEYKYTIDLDTRTFSSSEDELVLDFSGLGRWTFKTGISCTFKTGDYCTFKTYANCTFKTGKCCTFKTGKCCTFNTGECSTFDTLWSCTFDTGDDCTFDTGKCSTFDTGKCSTFKTGNNCTFDTGECCTFMLWYINTCKFKSYDSISIILDLGDKKHYVLTKELIKMLKVKNG